MATNHTDGLNAGVPDHTGLDELGKAELQRRIDDRTVPVTGNYADLQRAGMIGEDGVINPNDALPPGTSEDEAVNPVQAEIDAGVISRETERTGDAEKFQADADKEAAKAEKQRAKEDNSPTQAEADKVQAESFGDKK